LKQAGGGSTAASDGDGIRLLTRLLGAVDFDSARWWYKQKRMAGQMYVLGQGELTS